jgi:hypothetical protein
MTDIRICPECVGTKVVEYESRRPCASPDGPRWESWIDTCPLCDGTGEIEVEPIEMEDLCDE